MGKQSAAVLTGEEATPGGWHINHLDPQSLRRICWAQKRQAVQLQWAVAQRFTW